MRRKKDKSNGITALYERLSRDDDNAGESNSIVHQKQMFVICIFGIFFLVGISGIVNMVMWKLEVNGDEITWRSTFGKKRTFRFGDITYCERKKGSVRVYVNGEKLFTIDSNIDKEEFMEDIERRRIPVKSYWTNQHKKNRK